MMKLLRILVVLLAVLFIGGAVYLSVQNGSVHIDRETEMNVPDVLAYRTVTNLSKWPTSENDELQNEENKSFLFDKNQEKLGTITLIQTDSITGVSHFKFISEDFIDLDINLVFSSTSYNPKKSMITWSLKGEKDLGDKASDLINDDGIDSEIVPAIKRVFQKLEQDIQKEMKKYSISEPVKISTSGGFHLFITQSTRLDNIKNLRPELEKDILTYMKSNDIVRSGRTKLFYEQQFEDQDAAIISVAIPVEHQFEAPVETGILCKYVPPSTVIKTVLKGDEQYRPEVTQFINNYLTQNGLKRSQDPVFEQWINENAINPAERRIEFYTPIQ